MLKRFAAALALTALGSGSALAAPITVDNCGSPLTFDKTPERLMVHDINMTEMAFALGLQDKIVGLSGISGWYKTTPEFDAKRGDIPELAPKRPSLETVVAAAPDLFFAGWNYGMSIGGELTPDALAEFGVKTLLLTESCIHQDKTRPEASLDLLYDDMLRLGSIFGVEDKARTLVDGWKQDIADIRSGLSGREGTRVFLFDSGEDKPFTSGGYAMPDAMIEAVGAVNVTGDMPTSWGRTSWETVAAANPEFLILLDYQNGGGAADLMAFLKDHPVMAGTDAVKHERFVALRYEELTPGPANIDAVRKLADAMKASFQ